MLLNGLKMACRFGLPPNSLGFCGFDSAPEKFKNCVINGECSGVEDEISKFIVLNPYLETLAHITGLGKYSHEVVEAYWLGNEHLNKATPDGYFILLDNFIKQGVPQPVVDELRTRKIGRFIPHHLFQVLQSPAGKELGWVNNCMIRWGKVTETRGTSLIADLNSLEENGKQFRLIKTETQAQFISDFLPNVKIGDTVAVHWKQAVKILDKREEGNLLKWTNVIISL